MPCTSILHLVFDLETFSPVDIRDAGADAYARDPRTDALCGAWVEIDGPKGGPIEQPGSWRPGQPPPAWASFPDLEVWAWNVAFDLAIWVHVLTPRYGWPRPDPRRFRCLMARAAYGNLPLKLEQAGKVLAAAERKDTEGHRLMLRVSRPARATVRSDNARRHHTPEALDALAAYCRQDVVAEAALAPRLPMLPAMEEDAFQFDRTVNGRGVAVDLGLVRNCLAVSAALAELHREELRSVTGGAVEKETKLAALASWLRAQGVPVATGKGSLDKEAVAALLASLPPGEAFAPVRRALRLRQALGRSSLAKFSALLAAAPDGRLRGAVQYYGAHQTGRWAGRLVQTQNMPKGVLGSNAAKGPTYEAARAALCAWRERDGVALLAAMYGDGAEDEAPAGCPGLPAVLGSLLRACFVAPPGKVLAIADFSAVEARGVLWLADDRNGLGAFARKEDLYCLAASAITGRKITKADPERNKLGKPCVLGFGYGMGEGKAADTFDLDPAIALLAKNAYRSLFPGVPILWREVERAAVAACRNPGGVYGCGRGGCVQWKHDGRNLFCRLPSGRCLWYRDAILVPGRFEGTTVVEFAYEDLMTKQWTRGTTWGGSFVENIVQALCRDLLLYGMQECELEGFPVVLHIHDEALVEVDDPGGDPALRKALIHNLEATLCRLPAWAAGFPAAAEGFLSAYWRK